MCDLSYVSRMVSLENEIDSTFKLVSVLPDDAYKQGRIEYLGDVLKSYRDEICASESPLLLEKYKKYEEEFYKIAYQKARNDYLISLKNVIDFCNKNFNDLF